MFKKPSKKQLLIRRIALSIVATIAVIIIVTATILFMLGYRLDGGNGRLEQGALLQFDSSPNNATVSVDDKVVGTTGTKSTVLAGAHSIKMTKNGYRDWNRSLELQAGTLTWLDYIRLVPNDLPVRTVTTYDALVDLKISSDKKWALAHTKADSPAFQLVDLRSETVRSSEITIPSSLYSDPTTPDISHSFSVVKWDNEGRYALVKHLYKDQTEWLVLDTQNVSQTINVTRTMSVSFNDLQFAGASGKLLYGLTSDGTIRKLDLSAETISRAFVSHVESFSIYDNKIISYIGTDPTDATKKVAGIFRDGDDTPYVMRAVSTPDTVLKIAVGNYYSNYYIAIAQGNIVTVMKGTIPTSTQNISDSFTKVTSLDVSGAVSNLSFSPNNDYIIAQSGANFTSYEIEHNRSADAGVSLSEGQSATTLRWLDGAHLWNDDEGNLIMRDFNGLNAQTIMTVTPGFDASLSQNGRFFYAVGNTDNRYHLQRVKMVLD
ncbi:MAG: PEGA domain-containing protein [Candidatus Microsaccharimonas sp.]